MSYSDLLDRMKRNDTEAFLEMTERYGWVVYSAIRDKYPDHTVADKIYNETMNAFYHSLAVSDAEDPLEALLHGFADAISPDKFIFSQWLAVGETGIPQIQLCNMNCRQKNSMTSTRKRKGFWHYLSVLLVFITIAGLLWIIAGLLMRMNYIPYFDLGYSWCYSNVMQLLGG